VIESNRNPAFCGECEECRAGIWCREVPCPDDEDGPVLEDEMEGLLSGICAAVCGWVERDALTHSQIEGRLSDMAMQDETWGLVWSAYLQHGTDRSAMDWLVGWARDGQ
jgi:hypothetical protein